MPSYQQGSEGAWWWKVAQSLDTTAIACTNATAHNLDDQTVVFVFQDRIREAQVLLLEILRSKGLLPAALPGMSEVRIPEVPGQPSTEGSPAVGEAVEGVAGSADAGTLGEAQAAEDQETSAQDKELGESSMKERVTEARLDEIFVDLPTSVKTRRKRRGGKPKGLGPLNEDEALISPSTKDHGSDSSGVGGTEDVASTAETQK